MTRRRKVIAAATAAAAAAGAAAWIRLGPLPPGLVALPESTAVLVVDRQGQPLYESRSADGTRRSRLDAAALPPPLVSATLAAEDARFYAHSGVDPIAIARAAWKNLRAWRRVEGGSTISQQVIKLLTQRAGAAGDSGRGWGVKLREMVLAERLEHRLSKREILALYLNLAPYGNQIEGAERASLEYFGRPASSLTSAEAAYLAALPQQPSRFNPRRDPARARARQLAVLDTEFRRGWLGRADYDAARAERLALAAPSTSSLAPHFVERVLAAAPHARRIETTLDASLQRTVEGIINAHRATLEAHHAGNVAVVVLDNATGEWLAWEGSGAFGDERTGGSIDGAASPRQPGSALKPFTYAAALERGALPSRVLADVPSQFPTAQPGVLYRPRNYDGQFRGPMMLRDALAGSENVPAVELASSVGVPAIAQLLRAAGITTLNKDAAYYGLGLTLGNAEVRLDELVAAYASFARSGQFQTPRAILSVDGAGAAPPRVTPVVSTRTAFWISSMLADDEARAYIFGRGGSLEFPFTVAAKTGTSTSYHDNWAIGFTRAVTVGVWVGNFDRSPLHNSSGVTGAGPIFHDVLMAAMERLGPLPIGDVSPIVAPPADLREVELCARSGMAPGAACPARVKEWLPVNVTPARCDWHFDSDDGPVTVWPEQYRDWARRAGYARAAAIAPAAVAAAGLREADDRPDTRPTSRTRAAALTIASPLAGATFMLDPTLRAEFQALPLRASGGTGTLAWSVDGAAIAGPRWPLARGAHRITVRDAAGRTASVSVVVK